MKIVTQLSSLLSAVLSSVFPQLGWQRKIIRLLLVVGALIGILPRGAAQGVPPGQGLVADSTELRVLRDFYNATNGGKWSNRINWMQGTTLADAGTWAGVTVANGDVTSLVSDNNNLQGSLPESLGQLTGLKRLQITGAFSLGGPIPSQLGQLRQLQSLVFSSTGVSGAIPAAIGQLSQLTYLSLYNNRLSGRIPPEIGNLTQLTTLYLGSNNTRPAGHGNMYEGGIPPELGRLINLTTLEISVTPIGGTIPPELGNLTNLTFLELDGNQLTGVVPSTLVNLKKLTHLLLFNNQLTQMPRIQVTNPAGLRLAVHANALDFASLEPQFTAPGQHPFGSFPYTPQASLAGVDTVGYIEGASLKITSHMDGQHNNYQWQRLVDTTWVDIAGATDTILVFQGAEEAAKGSYRARVTNSWVTGLTLYTKTAYAQLLPPPPDSLRLFLDNLVTKLDKSRVPTGLLEEFAVPLVPLDVFNGTLTDSSVMNPDGFRFLYATLYSSWLGDGFNPLPSPLELNARLDEETKAGTAIPVMVQHINYASIRPDAFRTKLLTIENNQLIDGNLNRSPYQVETIFAVAPATTYAATGDVTFVFPRTLAFERASEGSSDALGTLSVDFGDGRGYITAAWGQPVEAHYLTAGTKRVKVRVRYLPGNKFTYESHFDLRVAKPAVIAGASKESNRTTADLDFYISPTASHGGAKVSIHYGGYRTSLQNPLIVVEGYDKSSKAPLIQEKNYDLAGFLTDIYTDPNFNFRNTLEYGTQGIGSYDIVFVDFDNGTDDILRNGLVLEKVLAEVQQLKQDPTVLNVIMGMSMGGLIARYTLAKMTRKPQDTHTRLLILHDSPQWGANVPLGLQALSFQMDFVLPVGPVVGWLRTSHLSPKLAQAINLLSEPATKQMLVHTATNSYGGFLKNTFLADVFHPMIAGDTDSGRAYKVVATSQGSQCGKGLYEPYTELIRGNGLVSFGALNIVRSGFRAEAVVNALPADSQSRQVSFLELKSYLTLFGQTFSSTLFRRSYVCRPVFLAWDGVAGSTEAPPAAGFSLGENLNILGVFHFGANAKVVDEFTFLPTPSALSIPIASQAVLKGSYANGVGSPSMPFLQSFIAQESVGYPIKNNLPHLAFTPRNGEYMYNIMQNLPFANNYCAVDCLDPTTLAIKGSSSLCGTSIYTSPILEPGNTYNWTATPSSVFTKTSGTGSTFETANIGNNGSGTIQLTVNHGCTTIYRKEVSVGRPFSPQILAPDWDNDCVPARGVIRIDNYDPTLNYTIKVSSGITVTSPLQANGTYSVLARTAKTRGTITITVFDNCGSDTSSTGFETPDCGKITNTSSAAVSSVALDPILVDNSKAKLTILGNPVLQSNLRFMITGTSKSKKANISVMDYNGRTVARSTAYSLINTNIDVSRLPAGMYILVVKVDDLQLRQTFLK